MAAPRFFAGDPCVPNRRQARISSNIDGGISGSQPKRSFLTAAVAAVNSRWTSCPSWLHAPTGRGKLWWFQSVPRIAPERNQRFDAIRFTVRVVSIRSPDRSGEKPRHRKFMRRRKCQSTFRERPVSRFKFPASYSRFESHLSAPQVLMSIAILRPSRRHCRFAISAPSDN